MIKKLEKIIIYVINFLYENKIYLLKNIILINIMLYLCHRKSFIYVNRLFQN